jgi:hypothetical protein
MDVPGARDFDFLHGSWNIVSRRLTARLVGGTEWEEFPATGTCFPTLGGLGNVDDFTPEWPGHDGYIGQTFRFFDLIERRWSIYWADTVTGRLQPPVHGTFTDGIGTFYGEDDCNGIPVIARFIWSRITPTSALWEQAFSVDGGATWEDNWTMSFTRRN